MALILIWLKARIVPLRWILLAVLCLTVAWGTHRLDVLIQTEKLVAEQKKAADALAANQAKADEVGAGLEKKLAYYRKQTRGLQDAISNSQCVLTGGSLQSLIDANKAGISARQQ